MIQAFGLTSIPRKAHPPAVDDVSFEARAGRVTVLLGVPGAGKTTTLRLMLELQQGRGITYFRGRPLCRIAHPSREVGVVLGDVPGHPARTVRSHLRMLCAATGVRVRRADEVLEAVGLVSLREERLGTLSHGMDRRLGLACALLPDPHTLVLDEPADGLSGREGRWLHEVLRAHAAQGGTVLFTTADPKEAARTADRVVTMERGSVVADQEAGEFARNRLRPRVAVRSPHAARLAAVLAKEARTARRSVEVVREEGNRLSVYGSTTADVGETAYRHGILVHQLADEVGDMGPGAGMLPSARKELSAADPAAPDEPWAVSLEPGDGARGRAGAATETERDGGASLLPGRPRTGGDPVVRGRPGPADLPLAPERLRTGAEHSPSDRPGTDGGRPAADPADAEAAVRQDVSPHTVGRPGGTDQPLTRESAAAGRPSVRSGSESHADVVTAPAGAGEDADGPAHSDLAVRSPSVSERESPRADVDKSPHRDIDKTVRADAARPTRADAGRAPRGDVGVRGAADVPGAVAADRESALPEALPERHAERVDSSTGSAAGVRPDAKTGRGPLRGAGTGRAEPSAEDAAGGRSRTRANGHSLPEATRTGSRFTSDPLAPLPPPISVRTAASPLRPLRYELRRAAGIGTGFFTCGAVLVVSALTALLLARVGHTPQARLFAAWPRQLPLPPAALGAGLLGALSFGDEFRHPALAADRGTVPRRLGLLTAKLLVSGATALLLAFLTMGCDAEVLYVVYGREIAQVPADWATLSLSWFGLVIGCAWAGVLAAGVFRSTTAGLAAVLAVPVAVVPLVEKALQGTPVRTAAGFSVRMRELLLLQWPFGGEHYLAAVAGVIGQPVGSALALSLTALLCAYLLTALRSRVR